MMFDIKYHPLVDTDTDGTDKSPMFCVPDENMVKRGHKLYLEEIVPDRYRLCSSQPMSAEDATAFSIRCPHCGAKLKAISPPADGTRHGLFECVECLNHDAGAVGISADSHTGQRCGVTCEKTAYSKG